VPGVRGPSIALRPPLLTALTQFALFSPLQRSRPVGTLQGGCLYYRGRYITVVLGIPRPTDRLVSHDLPLNIAVWPGMRLYSKHTGGLKSAGRKAVAGQVTLWAQINDIVFKARVGTLSRLPDCFL
jgi:hypothetical protein